MSGPRTADPYRDLAVIDERGPRTNQATIGVLALAAYLADWPWLLGLLALQLAVGLLLGRRYCLPCRLWFDVLQPRFGEGRLEDARAPRFANLLGLVFLSAASAAHLLGQGGIGWALGLLVSALALIAATTGVCVGCELYVLLARLRGRPVERHPVAPVAVRGPRPPPVDRLLVVAAVLAAVVAAAVLVRRRPPQAVPARLEPAALGLPPAGRAGARAVVAFTAPLCLDCQRWLAALEEASLAPLAVDLSRRGDLARRYGIRAAPLVAVLSLDDGRVLAGAAGEPDDDAVARIVAAAGGVSRRLAAAP